MKYYIVYTIDENEAYQNFIKLLQIWYTGTLNLKNH